MGDKIKKLRNGEMTEGLINRGNRTLPYALGLSLSSRGTTHAVQADKLLYVRNSGKLVMQLVKENRCPRDCITYGIILNMMRVSASNTVCVMGTLLLGKGWRRANSEAGHKM